MTNAVEACPSDDDADNHDTPRCPTVSTTPALPLSDIFGLFPPTHVVGTTYTLSLAFFEAIVWPKLKRSALRSCVVLADPHGFRSSLVEAAALRGVGRDYLAAAVPLVGGGAFHPKVWMLVGDGEAALLAGSGNLTRSGFIDNAEVFDAVHLKAGGPHRAVADGALAFLDGLMKRCGENPLAREAVADTRAALAAVADAMPPDPDPPVQFLSTFTGPLVEQLAEPMGGGALFAAAPYFGNSTAGLELLHDRLKPTVLNVFPAVHPGNELNVSLAAVRAAPGVSAHRLALGEDRHFAHLKLYGADGPGGQWVFTTSANVTRAAFDGPNVEAGVLRAVSREDLHAYFTERPGEPLPSGVMANDFSTGGRWLTLAAADCGAVIELTAPASSSYLPLSDVEVVLTLDATLHRNVRPALFAASGVDRLAWSLFPDLPRRRGRAPLLTVRGRSRDGEVVEGAAFVDSPLDLSADPEHRGAWRAAVALLDDDGVPDDADLACVFHLLDGVFEPIKPSPATAGPAVGEEHYEGEERDDQPALWPPTTNPALAMGFHRGEGRPDLWFQRILSSLLDPSPTASTAGVSVASEGGDEDAEADEVVEFDPRAATLWARAGGSFDDLIDRLRRVVPTPASAPRIWPVASAVLLVTLATARKLARLPDVPTTGELVDRFLWVAFGPRSQGWRLRLADDTDRPTHPSLADELRGEGLKTVPSPDLADILLLLFAFRRARRERVEFPRDGWLLFRTLAPERVNGTIPATAETLFGRFLADPRGGVGWADVAAAFADLPDEDWTKHPGYRRLVQYATLAAGGRPDEVLSDRLRAGWEQNRRRVRGGKRWWEAVADRFRPCCPVPRCPKLNQADPDKLQLAGFIPVTCSGCGAVLVPTALLHQYEVRHGPLT